MPLHEINSNILKKDGSQYLYRFLQDVHQSVTLHIWQKKEAMNIAPDFGVEKFQLGHADKIIEWNGTSLTYGDVDLGEARIGMKQSPMMIMQSAVNVKELEFCRDYLNIPEHREIEGMEYICHVLEQKLSAARESAAEI